MDDKERTILGIEVFKKLHRQTLGYPYISSYGKDGKIMKDVLAVYKLEDLVKMLKIFFAKLTTDKFTSQTGASVGVFRTQIPKLLLEIKQDDDKSSRGILDSQSLAAS